MESKDGQRSSSCSGGIAEEMRVESVGVSPLHGGKDPSSSSSSSNVEQSSSSPKDSDVDWWTATEDGTSLNSEKAATRQPSLSSADTSGVDLKIPLPSFNLDDVNDGLSVTCDSGKDCVDVDRRGIGEGTARKDEVWSKECVRVHVKQEVEESGSHDSHVISLDSSDDDADDKLEKCKLSRISNL